MVSRRRYLGSLGAVLAGSVAGCSGATDRETATAAAPFADTSLEMYLAPSYPEQQLFDWYEPISDYLAAELETSVTLQYGETYKSVIDAVGAGEGRIASVGDLSAALGTRAGKVEVAVQRRGYGSWTYGSVLVTREDSPVSSLADVAGREIALADRLSTSGALMPLYMLQQAGLDIGNYPMGDGGDADFDVSFSSHDSAWTSLRDGDVDVAGVGKFITYDQDAGRAKDGVTYLDQFQNIPDPPLVTDPILSRRQTSALVEALVTAPDDVYLGADGTADTDDDCWFDGMRRTGVARYQVVIDAAESIGLNQEFLETSG